MRIDNVDCSQHIRRPVVLLKSVRHFADRYWDLQVRQLCFGSLDLSRQLCGVQGRIVQRFRTKLQDASDELGFRIRLQRLEEVVATSLPNVWIVPAEPYKRMDSEAVLPSGLNNIIAARVSSTEQGKT